MLDMIQYLEQTKAQIKAEEERRINCAKEQVLLDCQVKNQEIDKITAETISKAYTDLEAAKAVVTDAYNKQLVALEQKYQHDVKTYTENAENKKNVLFNNALQAAIYPITTECEKLITDLDNLIKKRTNKE